mmetsp:Transcript_41309/g.74472  ORF Transcript_41309/g.74472 Transcript_41309/m.74472 type:complete len:89 (+) Transcript_41309:1397-1663(+)
MEGSILGVTVDDVDGFALDDTVDGDTEDDDAVGDVEGRLDEAVACVGDMDGNPLDAVPLLDDTADVSANVGRLEDEKGAIPSPDDTAE